MEVWRPGGVRALRYWWGDKEPTSDQANFGRNVKWEPPRWVFIPLTPLILYDMNGNVSGVGRGPLAL